MNFRFALIMIAVWGLTCQTAVAQSWSKAQEVPSNYYAIRQQFLDFWKDKKPQKGQGYSVFKRWEWHWSTRIMPDGSFPPSDIEEVEWNKYLASLSQTRGPSAANWTSMGPNTSNSGYNGIGRVISIAIDPTDDNKIWVGTPAGGLWHSDNGGASWTTNTDNLVVLGVTAILIDPSDPNTMYIGTGDGISSDTRSRGVLKSTDGGVTWNTTGLAWNSNSTILIRGMVINPLSPNVVFVAASNGIWRTENGGTTWKKTGVGNYYDIELNAANPDIMFAATDTKVYKSVDGGLTWIANLTVPNSDRLSIAVTPADPDMVAAVSSSDDSDTFGAFNGLYVSKDGGDNFILESTAPNILDGSVDGSGVKGQGWYDLCIAISHLDANMIFVGGVNLWRSDDGGVSWSLASHWNGSNDAPPGTPVLHADKHVLLWKDNTLFKGCDGGLYKTSNNGATWADISSDLVISQMYRLGVSQSDSKAICGLQDNGTKLRSIFGNWTENIGGDGMECFIHPTNSNIMYGDSQFGHIRRSTNGGNNWTNIHQNVPDEPEGAWITPFVMDPNNSSTIYVGYQNLFKSTNQGNLWTAITPPELNFIFDLKHIAVAPSSSDVIYICDGDQIYRTTDGGDTWNNALGNLPTWGTITYLAVHPEDPNTVYVTLGGYSPVYKVFMSTNGGTTWTNISATLPNLPANCIVVQPNSNGVLYLGMDVGVYRRDAGATDWELFNTGLPNVIVDELEIRKSTGKIFAATYGRGLWQSDLAPLTVSDSEASDKESCNNVACIPNPARESAAIVVQTDRFQYVKLDILTVGGNVVATINNVPAMPGENTVAGYLPDLPTGNYFIRCFFEKEVVTGRVVVIR